MESSVETQTDRAFFARLGLAFAVSILVSGIMMVAVGPVPQDGAREGDSAQVAALVDQDLIGRR